MDEGDIQIIDSVINIFAMIPFTFLFEGDLSWILLCFQSICFGYWIRSKLK